MIVQAITGNDSYLFSGGYDKKVKAWTNLSHETPTFVGEVDIENCVNGICCGPDDTTVYVAGSDGYIKRAKFIL